MRPCWLAALLLPALATAQGTGNCHRVLDLGDAKILYSTMYSPSPAPSPRTRPDEPFEMAFRRMCGDVVVQGDVIHRVLYDGAQKPYFGFDIRITPKLETSSYRIEVTRPVDPKIVTLPQMPGAVEVDDGDRMDLDLLRHPVTQARVIDSFMIASKGGGLQMPPPLRDIPQNPPTGALLTLERPSLSNDVRVFGDNPQFGVTGPIVWVYAEKAGRFLFSPAPRPGYHGQAWAEGARIRFVDAGQAYDLRLKSNALARPGTWRLWVKHEPFFRPPPGQWTDRELRRDKIAIGAER